MTPGPFAHLIDDSLGQVIARGDGVYDIVFERHLKKPIEKVWAALTVPERIADWFTEVDLDPRVGGHYRIHFPSENIHVDGVIVAFEPPRLLVHTWPAGQGHPDSQVRYELWPEGDGCRLVLTESGLAPKNFDALPGWHTFLEALPGAADGIRTPWTWAREKEMGERYKAIQFP